jgi:hypothetical protein
MISIFISGIILFKYRFSGYSDELYLDTLTIFGISIGVEPPDIASIQVWLSSYLHFLFGVGSGLYQYYFDPFSIDAVFRYFKIVDALDSWRSNISLLNKLVSYGLVGFLLFYRLIFKIFSYYITNILYLYSFIFIMIFVSLMKVAELYIFILLPFLLFNLFGNIKKSL